MVIAGRGLTIERMVELARVSRASFYRFSEEAKPDRDMDLRDAIQRIAFEWPSYGRPRITAELRGRGWTVNPKRVYRLLREDNLLCVRKRKFVVTTKSNHGRKVCPNLAANMVLTGVDQLWRSDILAATKFCPWKQLEAQVDGGRVQRVQALVQFHSHRFTNAWILTGRDPRVLLLRNTGEEACTHVHDLLDEKLIVIAPRSRSCGSGSGSSGKQRDPCDRDLATECVGRYPLIEGIARSRKEE